MPLPKGWLPVAGSAEVSAGQAWVHKVTRRGDSRLYAIKRLKNVKRRARFRREVETMKLLSNEGLPVPPVIARDLDAERPWFVMPWYPQGSLEGVVRAGSTNDTYYRLQLVIAVARNLSLLHAVGVAHRDVKPSNVLLHDGGAHLADLGLCMHIEDGDRLTETEEAVGSRLYIVPENESGISEETDQRPSDFYSFGKLAWSTIAGKPPPARELLLLPKHRLESVVGDARLVAVHPLLAQLLNTDPRGRLASWEIVISELAGVVDLYRVGDTVGQVAKLDLASAIAAASRVATKRDAFGKRERDALQRDREEAARAMGQLLFRELENSLRDDFAKLNEAGSGEITFAVSSAGYPLSLLLGYEELASLRRPFEQFSLDSTSPALAAVSWSDAGNLDSHFYLGIYVAVADASFWLLRIPVMYRHRGQQEIFLKDFLPGMIAATGPLRLGLVGAAGGATRFAVETADYGRRMAVRCVEIVDRQEDPFNVVSWE